jgi:exodeoxyribonuclease X
MSAYFFDVESTDRQPPLEIIEAAWLRMQSSEDLAGASDAIPLVWHLEPWEQRYKPAKPSTFGAMAVHHILPHELEGCPPSSSFSLPADAEYIVGHNIDFDWQAAGSPPVKRICTYAMSKWIWPEATDYSQSALIYMLLGSTVEVRQLLSGAHSAMNDVRVNSMLLDKILAAKPGILTWSALWVFSEECRIPRTCPMKKYEGVLLDDLDEGFIHWCLRQDFIDPYYRLGLERVLSKRYSETDEGAF